MLDQLYIRLFKVSSFVNFRRKIFEENPQISNS